MHAAHAQQLESTTTASAALVDCPECGEPSSPRAITTWGHCRACRTAQSREMYPLRW